VGFSILNTNAYASHYSHIYSPLFKGIPPTIIFSLSTAIV